MAQQVLKKICEIGVGFSFAALSVFRLRRAEAASAVWIPHWHSEPFESQGARAAKRYVNGNLVERESSSASSQCIEQCIKQCTKQCINHHPEPRSGLCPELLADFRIPKPPGCSQGRRGQFSVQSDNRFSGRGGGVGSLHGVWRGGGGPAPVPEGGENA